MLFCVPRAVLFFLEGVPCNTNRGEASHQIIKRTAASASRRTDDNLRHITKEINDSESLRLVGDGFGFIAWEKMPQGQPDRPHEVRGGDKLIRAIGVLTESGVLSTGPAGAISCTRRTGQPRGFAVWKMVLEGAYAPSTIEARNDKWLVAVRETFNLTATVFHDRYQELFSCRRPAGSVAFCTEPLCPRCWQRTRGAGLSSDVLECRNHGPFGPRQGHVLGALVLKASEQPKGKWMVGERGGWDVELYETAKSRDDGTAVGVGSRTIGKVVYFFEHESNRARGTPQGTAGVKTLWAAVLQYVTAGTGTAVEVDAATGYQVYALRTSLSYYPVSFIRRVVHLKHCCPVSGGNECHVGAQGIHHALVHGDNGRRDRYLYNDFYVGVAPDQYD